MDNRRYPLNYAQSRCRQAALERLTATSRQAVEHEQIRYPDHGDGLEL
jgi:hypothetical protein